MTGINAGAGLGTMTIAEAERISFNVSGSSANVNLTPRVTTNPADGWRIIEGTPFGDTLAVDLLDPVIAESTNVYLNPGAGDDVITGHAGQDYIEASAGADTIPAVWAGIRLALR